MFMLNNPPPPITATPPRPRITSSTARRGPRRRPTRSGRPACPWRFGQPLAAPSRSDHPRRPRPSLRPTPVRSPPGLGRRLGCRAPSRPSPLLEARRSNADLWRPPALSVVGPLGWLPVVGPWPLIAVSESKKMGMDWPLVWPTSRPVLVPSWAMRLADCHRVLWRRTDRPQLGVPDDPRVPRPGWPRWPGRRSSRSCCCGGRGGRRLCRAHLRSDRSGGGRSAAISEALAPHGGYLNPVKPPAPSLPYFRAGVPAFRRSRVLPQDGPSPGVVRRRDRPPPHRTPQERPRRLFRPCRRFIDGPVHHLLPRSPSRVLKDLPPPRGDAAPALTGFRRHPTQHAPDPVRGTPSSVSVVSSSRVEDVPRDRLPGAQDHRVVVAVDPSTQARRNSPLERDPVLSSDWFQQHPSPGSPFKGEPSFRGNVGSLFMGGRPTSLRTTEPAGQRNG